MGKQLRQETWNKHIATQISVTAMNCLFTNSQVSAVALSSAPRGVVINRALL